MSDKKYWYESYGSQVFVPENVVAEIQADVRASIEADVQDSPDKWSSKSGVELMFVSDVFDIVRGDDE